MLQYIFLLMSDHFWKMSERILSCADMYPSIFQSLFHALLLVRHQGHQMLSLYTEPLRLLTMAAAVQQQHKKTDGTSVVHS